MPRTIKEVKPSEIGEIRATIQRVGTGPAQIAGMAKRFNIAESDMSALATAITTPRPKTATATTVTEAAPPPGVSHRTYESAVEILEGAERAEADLPNATLQDLQSLAALDYGSLMFRN